MVPIILFGTASTGAPYCRPRSTRAALSLVGWLPPFFEYHSRISYTKVENVGRNNVIQHPSVRACLQFLGIDDGVEIHHVADLPARSGLGTSSAFTVGLLLGLYALKNQMRDKHALASEAIHVEQELLREAVGAQDQVSAAYGGFNRINFDTDGSIEVRRMLASPNRLAELEQTPGALLYRVFPICL